MDKRAIGVVTFDLWDCLFRDDSDEAKRAAAGRPTKVEERCQLLHTALARHGTADRAKVDLAYATVDAGYRKVWHDQHVTWEVRERLEVMLQGLGATLPEDEFTALVDTYEGMELEFRPDPAPRAVEALRALHAKYPLAIVSDTVFTPGKNLRKLLDGAGMLEHFDFCAFSDEVGRSKPNRAMFDAVASHVGVPVESIVHIGDRPHNDLGGPHAVGARGVLLTVLKQRPLDGHTPDAVCNDYADLPEIIAGLDS